MKKLLLLLSLSVFAFAAYYFAANIEYSTDLNYLIYMSIWLILILISVIGIIYHFPMIKKQRHHVKNLMYNSYSERRTRNKEFDRQYQFFN